MVTWTLIDIRCPRDNGRYGNALQDSNKVIEHITRGYWRKDLFDISTNAAVTTDGALASRVSDHERSIGTHRSVAIHKQRFMVIVQHLSFHTWHSEIHMASGLGPA